MTSQRRGGRLPRSNSAPPNSFPFPPKAQPLTPMPMQSGMPVPSGMPLHPRPMQLPSLIPGPPPSSHQNLHGSHHSTHPPNSFPFPGQPGPSQSMLPGIMPGIFPGMPLAPPLDEKPRKKHSKRDPNAPRRVTAKGRFIGRPRKGEVRPPKPPPKKRGRKPQNPHLSDAERRQLRMMKNRESAERSRKNRKLMDREQRQELLKNEMEIDMLEKNLQHLILQEAWLEKEAKKRGLGTEHIPKVPKPGEPKKPLNSKQKMDLSTLCSPPPIIPGGPLPSGPIPFPMPNISGSSKKNGISRKNRK